jgi:serine/threonine protein kinase
VDERGEPVAAIEDGDGNLVPDRRNPVFYIPPWVTLPSFLEPHLAARNAATVGDMPYTIDEVLHFSNGGGIYAGRDTRTDKKVVLKEGRPHSGLDAYGRDAVGRLDREYDLLSRLAGIQGIPEVYDLFTLGEHRFMAMEFIDGEMLNTPMGRRYPLIDSAATPDDYAEYTAWAMDIHRQVEKTLLAVHERGVVYGDLHLRNTMVRPDGTITLLDFEVAAPVEVATRPGLAAQAFAPPSQFTGIEADLYSLACLRLALFLPMTELIWLHRTKAVQFAEIIAEHFPVPPEFLRKALDIIVPAEYHNTPSPTIDPDPAGWPELRAELVRSIIASATPDRDDRLFPGDIQQFVAGGGLGLGYGAAGVLYALSVTGAERHPELEEWLLRKATNPDSGTRPGLYDGLHGAALALEQLGYRQDALDVLDICLRENWEALGPDLSAGIAGIGLNLLWFADRTGEPALRVAAHRAAELVGDWLGRPDPAEDDEEPLVSGGGHPNAGLLRGCSGQALFLMRMFQDTGDQAYLDLAAGGIRRDLRRCVVRDNGCMEVNEGWRTMPYLATGSAGIGFVLDEFLTYRRDEQFEEALPHILATCQSTMYILPGLMNGRAGILSYLAGRSPDPTNDPLVHKQIRPLAWHVLPFGDGLAFPGTALLRLSMDLATGTAGVLLALGAALHDEPVSLPLLEPTKAPASLGAGR